MSTGDLIAGDRISFLQNGRKLKGVVADTLNLKSKKEELLIPVVRPVNRKKQSCKADNPNSKLKLRWIKRSDLRKLPTK